MSEQEKALTYIQTALSAYNANPKRRMDDYAQITISLNEAQAIFAALKPIENSGGVGVQKLVEPATVNALRTLASGTYGMPYDTLYPFSAQIIVDYIDALKASPPPPATQPDPRDEQLRLADELAEAANNVVGPKSFEVFDCMENGQRYASETLELRMDNLRIFLGKYRASRQQGA